MTGVVPLPTLALVLADVADLGVGLAVALVLLLLVVGLSRLFESYLVRTRGGR